MPIPRFPYGIWTSGFVSCFLAVFSVLSVVAVCGTRRGRRGWAPTQSLIGMVVVMILGASGAGGLAQGYDTRPQDALIIPLAQPGTAYEAMDLGVRGGTLRVDRTADPRTWNPHRAQDAASTWFTNRTHRGLINLDHVTGVLVPDLAASWEISEDGHVITFTLRRGIRWSDGVPITADDVVFTYQDVVLNKTLNSVFRDGQRLPDGSTPVCEKVDDHTVTFTLSTAFRPALSALGFSILPEHKLGEIVRSLPAGAEAEAFERVWAVATSPTEIVGNGPWQVTAYQPGVRVVLSRNPYYYVYDPAGTQLPYYDTVVCSIVQNNDASLLRFRSGESDVLTVRADDHGLLELESSILGFTLLVTGEPGPGITWFAVNQDFGLAEGAHAEKRSLYRTLEFRQALAHSVHKERMIDEVFNGLARPQWSPVPMSSPFYAGRASYGGPITEQNAVLFPYDPQRAATLLDRLGVVDRNEDGFRQLPSGAPLVMELMTSDDPQRVASSLILVEEWRALGLDATLRVVDFHVLLDRLSSGTGDIIYLSLPCADEPNSAAALYRSCGSLRAFRYSACAQPHAVDRRVDELLDLGAATFDLDRAFDFYVEYQQLVASQLWLVYTVAPAFQYAYYNYVGNAFNAGPVSSPGGTNGLLTELCFDRRL